MDTLFLYNTKTLKEKFKTKVFAGDNHITKINVQIPDNIGGYPKRECEFNLRAIIPEGNLSYMINPSQPYFYITNDITEKAQIVKLMMIITHEGNVIGRTNTVDLVVNEPAEAPDPPLTPRAEFDEVIAEQRAEIAEQAETINNQASQIEQDTQTISGLNSQVTELQGEVAEQQATITRQNTTIDELNRRVPPLQTLNPINPSQIQQTFNPESPNIGFPQVIVNALTAEGLGFDFADLKKGVPFLDGVGTYNPVYGTAAGGIYISEKNNNGYAKNITIKDWDSKSGVLTLPLSTEGRKYVEEIRFVGINDFSAIGQRAFDGYNSLQTIAIPSCIKRLNAYSFVSCSLLSSLFIPNSVTIIEVGAFYLCSGLQNVVIEQGFNANNLDFSSSTLCSVETIVSWLEALADRTGQTAYTLTIGTTNLNKLTAEQRAIATNKNWNLA